MRETLFWRHKKPASVRGADAQVLLWLKSTFGSFPITLTKEHVDTLLVLDGIWKVERGDVRSPFLFLAQQLNEGGEIELTTSV